jgi:hypothetical protein
MSYSDNQLVNKTTVTTATSAAKLWLNISGTIRQITVANFASTFSSLFSSTAKRLKIRTVDANAAVTSSDNILLGDTNGSGFSITLDTAANMYSSENTDTQQVTIRQINHNGNTLTILPSGGGLIDGSASYALTSDAGAAFVSDGVNIRSINV